MKTLYSFQKTFMKSLGALLAMLSFHAFAQELPTSQPSAIPTTQPISLQKNNIAIDIQDLLSLEDVTDAQGKDATFLKEHFLVNAALYEAILNTLSHGGYDESFHLYTSNVSAYISRTLGEDGAYQYTVLNGQEAMPLGYLKCGDASKLTAFFSKNNHKDVYFSNEMDTDTNSYLFIKLGATYTTPASEGLTSEDTGYYSWFEDARNDGTQANYYWFNKSAWLQEDKVDHAINGELWVSLPATTPSETFTWYISK